MIQALMDQVVIEPIVETKSKGGILLPGNKDGRQDSSEGTVVAVGPGKWENGIFVKTLVQKGERVLYHNYPTGVRYQTEDRRDLTIIQERQVVAVVKKGDDAKS